MNFRWFGTLGARVTLYILVALVLAQFAGVLIFVRSNEAERSEMAGEGFVRQVSSLVELFNSASDIEQQRFISRMRQPGFAMWLDHSPVIDKEGIRIPEDGPDVPANWGLIASRDKRLEWFADGRPLTMRYSIAPAPVIRNLPDAAQLSQQFGPSGLPDGPPDGPPDQSPGGPPLEGEPVGARPPPGAMPGGPPRFEPSSEEIALYGDAVSRGVPRGRAAPMPPPVRWRIAVQLENGEWLNAEHLYELGLPPWLETVMFQNAVTFALMVLLAVPAVGFATKRLSVLAGVADRLGRGEDTEPLPESGTNEIRRLTQAFNGMSLRLRRFVQGRTQMLAGISHDLRTPITALRLRADLVDDDENRERMLSLIDDMHHLTEGTLTLAKDESFTEKSDIVDVSSLIEGICDDLTDAGIDVTANVQRGVSLMCRPHSLRRAIRNLAENGAKYGKRSRISIESDERNVRIVIDDDGPGIPEDQMERAFQPFVRLEESRSRATGGSGLGLAITRSIVLNHGGDITLVNRPEGGLRAAILLPRPVGV